jgi:hypothetical protein
MFKFLCYGVGGREEENIKTVQEIGPAGTPFNAVIEQLNVPLAHLALQSRRAPKSGKTAQLQLERVLSHDFKAVTLNVSTGCPMPFSMTSPRGSACTA